MVFKMLEHTNLLLVGVQVSFLELLVETRVRSNKVKVKLIESQ